MVDRKWAGLAARLPVARLFDSDFGSSRVTSIQTDKSVALKNHYHNRGAR